VRFVCCRCSSCWNDDVATDYDPSLSFVWYSVCLAFQSLQRLETKSHTNVYPTTTVLSHRTVFWFGRRLCFGLGFLSHRLSVYYIHIYYIHWYVFRSQIDVFGHDIQILPFVVGKPNGLDQDERVMPNMPLTFTSTSWS
jgi:hypothetical protein